MDAGQPARRPLPGAVPQAVEVRWPPLYSTTRALDDLRAREYPLLDSLGHVYLDYTAGNLVPLSLVERHAALLRDHLLGNPHSTNPASSLTTTYVEQARLSVLEFFNADPDEYIVIFTANATQALKLVGEALSVRCRRRVPADVRQPQFRERHPRVRARERMRRPPTCRSCCPTCAWTTTSWRSHLERPRRRHRLFAYPAQSNFSGVQHPLDWIPLAQERGWDVLLDAAAFTPTNRLDLDRWKPDFVVAVVLQDVRLSDRRGLPDRAQARRSRNCGGRGLRAARSPSRRCRETSSISPRAKSAFEDGTPNYLALPAVEFGLQYCRIDRHRHDSRRACAA